MDILTQWLLEYPLTVYADFPTHLSNWSRKPSVDEGGLHQGHCTIEPGRLSTEPR